MRQNNDQEPKYSKYNEAQAQVMRIAGLWDSCHTCRKNLNTLKWNIVLDCIWMELYADAEDKDREKIKEYNKKFTGTTTRDKKYQILLQKEGFLRKLQNRQGKGAIYSDIDADQL